MSNYSIKQREKLAAIFAALSNANRLKLFLRLVGCCMPGARARREEASLGECVGELARQVEIAPSTVSHHIKELRRAGLIEMRRRGKYIDCRVDAGTLRELAEFFAGVIAQCPCTQEARSKAARPKGEK